MHGQVLDFQEKHARKGAKNPPVQYEFFPHSSVEVFLDDRLTNLAVKDGHAKAMRAVLELYKNRHKQLAAIDTFPKSSDRKLKGTLNCPKPLSPSELVLLDRTYELELAAQLKKTLHVPIQMTERGIRIPGTEEKGFNPRNFVAKQQPHVVTQQEADHALSQAIKEVHYKTRGAFTPTDLYRAATGYLAEKGIGYRETRTMIATYFKKSKDAIPIFKANSNVQHYYSRTFALAERQRSSRVRDAIAESLASLRQTLRNRYGKAVREPNAKTPSQSQQRYQGTHSNIRLKSSSYRDATNEKLKTHTPQRQR